MELVRTIYFRLFRSGCRRAVNHKHDNIKLVIPHCCL